MSDVAIDTAMPGRKRMRKYGVAPLPSFDFANLPDGTLLTTAEVAAVLRLARGTVAMWRQQPDHPLRWERVAGRPLYRAGAVREFITRK